MSEDNPFLKRISKNKQHGTKAEKYASKRMKAVLHPSSGAKACKGDMTIGDFKIENKATVKKSIRLPIDWLIKISQESMEAGKIPALAIQYVNSEGRSIKSGRWVCIPESVFLDIKDSYDSGLD